MSQDNTNYTIASRRVENIETVVNDGGQSNYQMEKERLLKRIKAARNKDERVIPFRTARYAGNLRPHGKQEQREKKEQLQVSDQQENATQAASDIHADHLKIRQVQTTIGERVRATSTLPFQVETHRDDRLYEGEYQIVVKGIDGTQTSYDRVVFINGIVDERQTIQNARVERVDPINEVRMVGTKPVIRQEMRTEVSEVPFETTYIYEESVPAGQTKVRLEGRKGIHTHTVQLTYKKDQLVKREIVKTVQTTPVRHRLVAFGDVVVPNLAYAKRFIHQNPSVKRFIITDGKNQAYLQRDCNGYEFAKELAEWSLHFKHAVPVVAFYEGEKDISLAINKAIDAAIAMRVPRVEMPSEATFNCDHTIVIKNGLSILNGNKSTLIATAQNIVKDGMSALIAFEPDIQHAVVSGFQIDMRHTQRLRTIIAQGARNVEISHNHIYNIASNALLITTSALSKTNAVRILHNQLSVSKQLDRSECAFNLIDIYGVASHHMDQPQENGSLRLAQPAAVSNQTNEVVLAWQHQLHEQVAGTIEQSQGLKQPLTAADILIESNRFDGGKCGVYLAHASHNRILKNEFKHQLRNITLQNQALVNEIKHNLLMNETGVAVMIEEGANYNYIAMNYIALKDRHQTPIVVLANALGNQIENNQLVTQAEVNQQQWLMQLQKTADAQALIDHHQESQPTQTAPVSPQKPAPTKDDDQTVDLIDFDPKSGDKIRLDQTLAKRLKGRWFAPTPEEITDETVIFQRDNELYVDTGTDAAYFVATKFATLPAGIQLQQKDFIV